MYKIAVRMRIIWATIAQIYIKQFQIYIKKIYNISNKAANWLFLLIVRQARRSLSLNIGGIKLKPKLVKYQINKC